MLQRYADKAVSIAESATRGKIGDKLFAFSQYPAISERIRELTDEISTGIETAIVNGVEAQWTLSNNKNSELANVVFGVKSARNLPKAIQQRYYTTNENARHAFLARKNAGMSLSGRVWNLTEQFKEELELALDCGIRSGRSADELSRVVRRYLNNPTALFRRVRNEFGVLELSKRAKAYHPGQGVYRSAYKNARRLTATETNIAYRTSDFLRWQSFDFVVGIQIKLSNNHTLNGMPFVDICDDLAGFYPKWFKFTGWHPLCRCYAVPVFKSEKEMREDTERILSGMEPIAPSESTMAIKEYPSQLNKWIEKNKDRIHKAAAKGTLSYFIRDNRKVFGLEDGEKEKGITKGTHLNNGITYTEETLQSAKLTKQAAKPLQGTYLENPHFHHQVLISGRSIKEWSNQPFKYFKEKNELLLKLDQEFGKMAYIGVADNHKKIARVIQSHIFESSILGEKFGVVVREWDDGQFILHSISDGLELNK